MLAKKFRVWQNRSVLIAFPSIIVAGVSVRCQYEQVMNLTNPLSESLAPKLLKSRKVAEINISNEQCWVQSTNATKAEQMLPSRYEIMNCQYACLFSKQYHFANAWCKFTTGKGIRWCLLQWTHRGYSYPLFVAGMTNSD